MNLKSKVLTAFGWSAGTKFAGQIVTWALTIIVVRLLTPEDYGLLAMAMIFVSFLDVFGDLGMGAALIQARESSADLSRRIFGVIVLVNLSLYGLLFTIAPLIADFFNEPRLVDIIRVIAIRFIFLIFETVPRSLLERDMDFKYRSIVVVASAVIGGVSTLLMAWYGLGVWSLVLGSVLTGFCQALGMNLIKPYFKLPSFDFSGMKKYISFGGYISLERALIYIQAQSDSFIIGKLLGKESLGFYSMSRDLASMPMLKLMATINQVALPAYASIQDDAEKIAYYFLKVMRITAFFAFPVFFGISAVSEPLILTLIGDKWAQAIMPMQILCLIMPLRMLGNLLPSVLRGVGRPDINVVNVAIAAILMTSAFVVGSQWGLLGVCLAWVLVYPLVFFIMIFRAEKTIHISFFQIVSAIYKSVISSAIMYAGVTLMSMLLPASWHSAIHLFCLIVTGAAVFVIATWVFHKDGFDEAINLVRKRNINE